jgi:LAS superfamily LD-carboxypeptidase LdcB
VPCLVGVRGGVSTRRVTAAHVAAGHPDPKWVAPPGQSLHRYGTELDLGPPAAYGWLEANGRRFGFIKRYSWELGTTGDP